MSRFLVEKHAGLKPYIPGEQPQNGTFIKLNTNESPFEASPKARAKATSALARLQRYPDPDIRILTQKLADHFGLDGSNVLVGNGSDEVLNFAFMAFCDENCPAVFPDITYGFYPVFAMMNGIPSIEIPLKEDLSIDTADYRGVKGTLFIANPNAHTGIALGRDEIEAMVEANPDNLVVVDEAYVDFGAESSVELINRYDNIMVIQTMSKSRSLAGARVGYALGNSGLIRDLNTLRNSTNPYNINAVSMAAAEGVLEDEEYTAGNCRLIMENRDYTAGELKRLGFQLTESLGNFVFMKHPDMDGGKIYEEMKKRGVLIRHFDKERIKDYNRVTIGSREQMESFIKTLEEIL